MNDIEIKRAFLDDIRGYSRGSLGQELKKMKTPAPEPVAEEAVDGAEDEQIDAEALKALLPQ